MTQTTGLSTHEYDNVEKEIDADSIHYKVGQRIKEWRLIRRYTQKDLADKVGLTPKEIHDYEKGYTVVTYDRLYEIAKALSVKVRVLLPETIKKDKSNETEGELLSLVSNKDQESWSSALVETLSKSMKVIKEKVKKAEKIRVAKNLLKLGISIHVILQTTGVPAEEIL